MHMLCICAPTVVSVSHELKTFYLNSQMIENGFVKKKKKLVSMYSKIFFKDVS